MPLISFLAHFDGQQNVLDEPVKLSVGQRLIVTMLDTVDDRCDFYRLAENGLAAAYGLSELEYTEADIRPTSR